MEYDESDVEGGEEGQQEEGGGEIVEGGIVILSDSDDDESEEEEEDEGTYMTDAEKRKKVIAQQKAKFAKKKQKERDAPPPKIKRFHNGESHRIEFGDGNYCELRLSKGIHDCKNAVIFEGLPSKGLASVLISRFLIKGLELPLIGVFVSDLLPSLCRVADFQATSPCCVYGNSKVVVITGELPMSAEIAPIMTDMVLFLQNKLDSPFIFCAESIPKDIKEMDVDLDKEISEADLVKLIQDLCVDPKKDALEKKKEKEEQDKGSLAVASKFFGSDIETLTNKSGKEAAEIMYITNDEATSTKLKDFGFLPVRNAVVGNVTGHLIAESVMSPAKVVCLVARYNPVLSDARASVMLCRTMGLLVETELNKEGNGDGKETKWLEDYEWLEKKADKIEKQIKKSVKEMGASMKNNQGGSSIMYT
mmetsp:Transcript_17629/g.27598  ORF Transcript_17629/g.27598 Transcript_17629/m.27598 type:complete len:420 (-) Transcript_17629:80-1339(-)